MHLLSSFGLGGQERVALDLARGQVALGVRALAVSLAPPPEGPLAAAFAEAGAEAHTIAKRSGFDPTLTFRLARFLSARRREHLPARLVLHTHNPQPLIYGAPAARWCGLVCVHTKHGANPDGGRRLWLRRQAARLAHAYVAVSERTEAVARQNREASLAKLTTIPNGIDLARFQPDANARRAVREELGLGETDYVVGTVGRLAKEKDQALLIAAMARLAGTDGPALTLVIVGDGPERAELEALAAPLAGRVRLIGARSDVPRLLAAFDLFALSSRTEGLPLVIVEAMAAGLPVVSTAVGGIPGVIVDGATAPADATGQLVPPGDAAALADAIDRLARDPALGKEWGARGRARAREHYGAERMVRDYLALYQRLLGPS